MCLVVQEDAVGLFRIGWANDAVGEDERGAEQDGQEPGQRDGDPAVGLSPP